MAREMWLLEMCSFARRMRLASSSAMGGRLGGAGLGGELGVEEVGWGLEGAAGGERGESGLRAVWRLGNRSDIG